ncbi:hypothetical protein [Tenacibaculum sp. C7A-26P2]|uniref:hypothetical protein n=1 Tax=Tenacibaculum sp. C7A-26P2 TaxID=3447504 RepID=UPI003F8672B8
MKQIKTTIKIAVVLLSWQVNAQFDSRGNLNIFSDLTNQPFVTLGINQTDRWSIGMYEASNPSYTRSLFIYEDHTGVSGSKGVRFLIKPNGNVGIGTTNPSSQLEIKSKQTKFLKFHREGLSKKGHIGYGTANQGGVYIGTDDNTYSLWVQQNGNVGIGTTSPKAKQHLFTGNSNGIKDLYVTSIIEGMDARLQLMSSNAGSNGSSISLTNESSSWTLHQKTASLGNRFDIGYRVSTESEDIAARQNIYFSILKDGNVGIGTVTTGNHKLAVEGSIGAREIKVEAFPDWSDFVFYDDYQLPTLTEVENHIKEKGHLKDIPSAEEVEKNGFYLGEMDAKLLQKIEELTLYTIAQEKEIKELKKEKAKNRKQEEEIEELKKQNSEIKELKALVQKLIRDKN